MRTRKLVDVIVLGGRVGALASACILARRGYKVVHVEHEGLWGRYSDYGLELPLEPELVPGPKSSPIIEHVLGELALVSDAIRVMRPIDPDLQILTPGHRFNLSRNSNNRIRELAREFGDASKSLDARIRGILADDESLDPFIKSIPPIPPGGFCERRIIRKASAGMLLDDEPPPPVNNALFESALAGLARLSSHLYTTNPSRLHNVRSMARILRGGLHRLEEKEGTWKGTGYPALLRHRLEELGGDSLSEGKAIAEEIIIERGRIAGIRLVGDRTDYRCRFLISGVDTAVLHRLIPMEGRRQRFDIRLNRVRPKEMLFSINLLLPKKAVPVGLGELALYISGDENHQSEESLILLQKFDAIGKDGLLPHMIVLQASCFMPANRRDQIEGYLDDLTKRVLDVLRGDLLPFLDRNLVMESSPMLTRKGPARGARLMPHPLFESDLDSSLGVGLLTPFTPYKNLVIASREVLPGLGIEGEFLAALRASDIVAAASKK